MNYLSPHEKSYELETKVIHISWLKKLRQARLRTLTKDTQVVGRGAGI